MRNEQAENQAGRFHVVTCDLKSGKYEKRQVRKLEIFPKIAK